LGTRGEINMAITPRTSAEILILGQAVSLDLSCLKNKLFVLGGDPRVMTTSRIGRLGIE
jgi:hypothetical protein